MWLAFFMGTNLGCVSFQYFCLFRFGFVISGQLVGSPGCELAFVVVGRAVDVMERG